MSCFARRTGEERGLRGAGRLASVPRRTALAEKNPRVIGPTLYEHLPVYLRGEENDETFCSRLKNLLLENVFYSVKEFLNHNFNEIAL